VSAQADLGSRVLSASGDLAGLARSVDSVRGAFPSRVRADPETVEKGLAQLVLTLIELLRQLMERQALRRMDAGSLDDEEIERLGQTFMKLADRMDELKEHFGLRDEDLNLNLGPLGDLL
jgi:gas vesicle protein GvpK